MALLKIVPVIVGSIVGNTKIIFCYPQSNKQQRGKFIQSLVCNQDMKEHWKGTRLPAWITSQLLHVQICLRLVVKTNKYLLSNVSNMGKTGWVRVNEYTFCLKVLNAKFTIQAVGFITLTLWSYKNNYVYPWDLCLILSIKVWYHRKTIQAVY